MYRSWEPVTGVFNALSAGFISEINGLTARKSSNIHHKGFAAQGETWHGFSIRLGNGANVE